MRGHCLTSAYFHSVNDSCDRREDDPRSGQFCTVRWTEVAPIKPGPSGKE